MTRRRSTGWRNLHGTDSDLTECATLRTGRSGTPPDHPLRSSFPHAQFGGGAPVGGALGQHSAKAGVGEVVVGGVVVECGGADSSPDPGDDGYQDQ
ncbi:hypothetical protein ACFQ61_33885 [Streptomyces sp. NPDC056500]|uniref:hypothetical protein n=1 Tax=Streptomyces sp. NPDC056500 TaxID=3345840 RepID=UPI0036B919DB